MKTAIVVSVSPTSFEALALAGDVEGAFALAAREGFSGVEIAVRDPGQVRPEAIKRLALDHGLEIAAIGTGQAYIEEGLSLSSPDKAVRAAAVKRLKRQLDLGRELGARVIIGLIRGTRERHEVREGLDLVAEGLSELSEYGSRIGAPGLLVEPINRYETRLLNSVEETAGFLDRLGAPGVMLLADTFHMNIEDRDLAGSLVLAGERLGHVHFADSNRHAPGQGHIDFGPVFAALDTAKYDGFLSAEVLPEPSPGEAVQLTARFFRAAGMMK